MTGVMERVIKPSYMDRTFEELYNTYMGMGKRVRYDSKIEIKDVDKVLDALDDLNTLEAKLQKEDQRKVITDVEMIVLGGVYDEAANKIMHLATYPLKLIDLNDLQYSFLSDSINTSVGSKYGRIQYELLRRFYELYLVFYSVDIGKEMCRAYLDEYQIALYVETIMSWYDAGGNVFVIPVDTVAPFIVGKDDTKSYRILYFVPGLEVHYSGAASQIGEIRGQISPLVFGLEKLPDSEEIRVRPKTNVSGGGKTLDGVYNIGGNDYTVQVDESYIGLRFITADVYEL